MYMAPDIRKQSMDQIYEHIQQKRVRRMIVLTTYQDKQRGKFEKIESGLQERFNKRLDMTTKAVENIQLALEKAEKQLAILETIDRDLSNTEQSLLNL